MSTVAHTTPEQLDAILDAAQAAVPTWGRAAPSERARVLIAVADALDADADRLVGIAERETGLSEARLRGELTRTTVQLRLFADVIREGSYLDARIDEADDHFVLGTRPELRRVLAPVGVALNFSASNFPFAFSVAGGDSAAALAEGSVRTDEDGQVWAMPTIAAISADRLRPGDAILLDEVFGPFSLIVEYDDEAALADRLDALYEGNLTGTVHTGTGEDSLPLSALVAQLQRKVGRVLFNGWPTGVAVTYAQQHGGPYPATTNDSSTSVGTAAITRFLRAVAFQDAPQDLLPPSLRDDNPWSIPQRREPAGASQSWGQMPTAQSNVTLY